MKIKKVTAPWAPDIEPLVNVLINADIPRDAVEIYRGRNRVVKLHRGNRDINIKAFRIPNLINRIAYTTLRRSKACRSYENSLRLRNMGFNTPEPLAFIEIRRGMLLGKSYFISQQLDGFHELRAFMPGENIDRLADELGALIARLHDVGVWVKDFSQGNVLRRVNERGHYDFYLVDLNRMAFDVTDPRKLMTNFWHITEDERFWYKLVKAYARHSGKPYADALAQAHKASRYRFLKK
ncbi:MAG: lipopolysaccharide kinase InaA family protein [Muribaculaceae bacterium]|nr:lipopolysaccharide kinase InaA family protein [Muribaculaceae bacterium]